MDYSKFVSKKEKWLKLALVLAIIMMIIGYLALTELNKREHVEDDSKDGINLYDYAKWLIPVAIVYLLFTQSKKLSPVKTDEEIIKYVADEIYVAKGIYLNTSLGNVRVQKGGVDETYVEFLDKCLTILYVEGVGITERYPGESIKTIKKGKQGDVIEMKLADQGLARKKHKDILESYDLTEEEQ